MKISKYVNSVGHLSAMYEHLRNVEDCSSPACQKAGVDKESNAERGARLLQAITHVDNSFQSNNTKKNDPDFSLKIISDMESFATFVLFEYN